MSKYIDAERLLAEIESIRLIPQTSADYNDGRDDMKMMVLDLIDSLQQEQPIEGKPSLTTDDIKLITKIYNEVLFRSFKVRDMPSEILRRFNEQRKK